MARFETFDRDLRVALAELAPEKINAALAQYARQELADVIARGEGSPSYRRFVNGREGISESAVNAPGPIVYDFVWWKPLILFAIAELQRRSPTKTGRFARSFLVVSGGQVIDNFDDIQPAAEVIITNFQPYVRKVESGSLGIPRQRLFEGTKRLINSRFSDIVRAEMRFLDFASGVHPDIPYVLKGGYAGQRARWLANPARYSRRFPRRKGRDAGQKLTYPSIVLNLEV